MRLRGHLPIQHLALVHLAVLALVLTVVLTLLLADGPLSSISAVYVFPLLVVLYVSSGLLAWWRRPANRLGPLLVAAGTAFGVSGLQNTGVAEVIAIGKVNSTLPLAVLLHLLHALPSGRVRGRWAKAVVVTGYVDAFVLQVPQWAFSPDGGPPFDALLISDRPDLVADGLFVQNVVGLVIVLLSVVLLSQRLRAYDARQRTVLGPLFAFGMLALIAIPVGREMIAPRLGPVRALEVEAVPIGLVPIGFLFVVLVGGFARMGELSGLMDALGRPGSAGSADVLQAAMSDALGDPSVQLLLPGPDGRTHLDVLGARHELPPPGSSRASVELTADEVSLGALVYDPDLSEDVAAIEPMLRVAAIALDRARLAKEAADSREALRDASSRVLSRGDDERRKVARDLHDGLQGSLVRLGITAHQLADSAEGSNDAALARRLAEDIDRAAADLRALVRGVLPTMLAERGLTAALAELAGDLPVRVQLDVEVPDRLARPVESTAYFVVAEALTNVVKHAGARQASVHLSLRDEALHLEVTDDGVGGARVTGPRGGLAGLHDRLAVLGGQLDVESDGQGTRVRAVLPCAS